MNEFAIIKKYFAANTQRRTDVSVGIGDDAAVVSVPSDQELVITTDTLIAGVHFPLETNPFDIGYKSLAVNLSDLAAMGATPAWFNLALTLTEANPTWLDKFCQGLFNLANQFNLQLIGGDLTHGPLSITIHAMGIVAKKQALLRSNAKPNDHIYVTGTLGDAGLALRALQHHIDLNASDKSYVLQRLNRPEPRIRTGQLLLTHAHAAIDISDGLAADLSHILEQSNVGAVIEVDRLPKSSVLTNALPFNDAITLALTAGDDYELCFTLPPSKKTILSSLPCATTYIGYIIEKSLDPAHPRRKAHSLKLHYQNGTPYHGTLQGYKHF